MENNIYTAEIGSPKGEIVPQLSPSILIIYFHRAFARRD